MKVIRFRPETEGSAVVSFWQGFGRGGHNERENALRNMQEATRSQRQHMPQVPTGILSRIRNSLSSRGGKQMINFVSTFPPMMCGIGTYTNYLVSKMIKVNWSVSSFKLDEFLRTGQSFQEPIPTPPVRWQGDEGLAQKPSQSCRLKMGKNEQGRIRRGF